MNSLAIPCPEWPAIEARGLDVATNHIADALASLDGARIFMTGGTGFIGRALLSLIDHARARLGCDIRVEVLTRDQHAFKARHPIGAGADWLTFADGDTRDFEFPTGPFTHVIHAATDTSVAADANKKLLASVIIDGARQALDFAHECRARRFLYLSSGAVYGRPPVGLERIPEDFAGAPDPLDPAATYGVAKRGAETMCAASNGIHSVIARIFTVAGPGLPLDAHFALGNFVRDALAGRDIIISGDGTPLRSYIDVHDLAAWLIKMLVGGRAGVAYNVGGDQPISIRDLAFRTNKIIGGAGRVIVAGKPDPNAARAWYVPSIDLARRELSLDAWTSIDETITRTAKYAMFARENSNITVDRDRA